MARFGKFLNIIGTSVNYRNILSVRSIFTNVQLNVVLKAYQLEKLGLPPKPKRPMTPFFLYMRDRRQKVSEENPNLTALQVVKKISLDWSTCDLAVKQIYQKTYDQDLLNYSKQIMIYEQSMTPEQKELIAKAKEDQSQQTKRRELKKKIAALGKPRRPPTGFIQFLQERKYAKNSGDFQKFLLNVSEEWKIMSPEEKLKYKDESKRLMTQYKTDLREWEEKMVELGHIDVVTSRGLLGLKTTKEKEEEEE